MNVENLDPTDPPTKFARAGRDPRRQPARARHRGRRGGPGQRRRRPTARSTRRLADLRAVHRRDRSARRPDVRVPPDRPGRPTRTAASRAATSASASCSAPTAGSTFVDRPGGTATTPTAGRRRRRDGAAADASARAASTRRTRRSTTAASRSRASSAGAGGRCSRSRTTSTPRAATTRCSGAVQPPVRSHRGRSATSRPTVVGDFVEQLLDGRPPGAAWSCSGTSTTSSSPRRCEILEGSGLDEPDGDAARSASATPTCSTATRRRSTRSWSQRALLAPAPEYDSVHVNAEFADQASDHDPQVARLAADGRRRPGTAAPRPAAAAERSTDGLRRARRREAACSTAAGRRGRGGGRGRRGAGEHPLDLARRGPATGRRAARGARTAGARCRSAGRTR